MTLAEKIAKWQKLSTEVKDCEKILLDIEEERNKLRIEILTEAPAIKELLNTREKPLVKRARIEKMRQKGNSVRLEKSLSLSREITEGVRRLSGLGGKQGERVTIPAISKMLGINEGACAERLRLATERGLLFAEPVPGHSKFRIAYSIRNQVTTNT